MCLATPPFLVNPCENKMKDSLCNRFFIKESVINLENKKTHNLAVFGLS